KRLLEQLLQSLVVFLDQVQCVHGAPPLQPLCLDLRPYLGELITRSEVIEQEVGFPKCFSQQPCIERTRRVAALARGLDTNQRQRRVKASNDGKKTASLVSGP